MKLQVFCGKYHFAKKEVAGLRLQESYSKYQAVLYV